MSIKISTILLIGLAIIVIFEIQTGHAKLVCIHFFTLFYKKISLNIHNCNFFFAFFHNDSVSRRLIVISFITVINYHG